MPLWAGLLGAFLVAPRKEEDSTVERFQEALKRLKVEPETSVETILEGLPEGLRSLRAQLYHCLRLLDQDLPQPLGELYGFELLALDEVLEEREAATSMRLEVLEWACLRAPDSEAARTRLEACLEDLSTELALLDLKSIVAAVDSRYQELKLVGQGAMGLILQGQDQAMERPVALKVVNPSVLGDADTTGRFWREIEALSNLTHPHVVQIYGVYPGTIPYYVMEFLPGRTLQDAVAEDSLDPVSCLEVLEQFAGALDFIHQRGILHRDLKPENLLLAEEKDTGKLRLVVIDFGVAKGAHSRPLTQTGDILGTLSYMAPEQLRGGVVDGAADRFAYGAIAFEVITGRRPYRTPYQAEKQPPPPFGEKRLEISSELEAELSSLLETDPQARPQDLGRIRDLLQVKISSNHAPIPPLSGP
jgi:predicted Ser/Thr protein kinase